MSNFGDIRSAIHEGNDARLALALRDFEGTRVEAEMCAEYIRSSCDNLIGNIIWASNHCRAHHVTQGDIFHIQHDENSKYIAYMFFAQYIVPVKEFSGIHPTRSAIKFIVDDIVENFTDLPDEAVLTVDKYYHYLENPSDDAWREVKAVKMFKDQYDIIGFSPRSELNLAYHVLDGLRWVGTFSSVYRYYRHILARRDRFVETDTVRHRVNTYLLKEYKCPTSET